MKNKYSLLIGVGFLVAMSGRAVVASPGGFYLVSPSKVECKGKSLSLEFELPCSNEYASEWSDIVASHDDSGDREVVVGIAAAMSSCEKSDKSRAFKISTDVAVTGISKCEGASFVPMTMAR